MLKFLSALVFGSLLLGSVSATAQGVDAARLLQDIRFSAALQNHDLQGQVRKGRTRMPLTLFMREENIQFHFTGADGKANRFHVRLGEDDIDLFEIRGGKTLRFPGSKLGQAIGGTDLTYEDIALRFLYWNTATIVGEEKIGIHDCYKLRVVNPTNKGRYGIVNVWVHKKHHALIQVLGYNKAGKPLKSFKITSIMKVGKVHTVKQMRVDTLNPETGRSAGVTYMEFEKPKRR